MADNIIEIEVDNGANTDLFFHPIGISIRGRFDFMLMREPLAKSIDWGPVPGQRLRLNTQTQEGFIIEPLHEDPILLTIKNKGYTLPPREQKFAANVEDWIFWMKRAVDSGCAKLIQGKLPEKLDHNHRVLRQASQDSHRERMIDQLIAVMYGQMSEKAKREFHDLLSGV